jgi:anti-sigma regulatory factor (Ser/Thr protein kinase)
MSGPRASSHPRDGTAGRSVSFTARLPRDRTAAAAARGLIREHLGHRVPSEMLDDVLLVVSELATNAMLHGTGDIGLGLAFDGSSVTGSVDDDGGGFHSSPGQRSSRRIGGHGLYLVNHIASSWGVREGTGHVWFEIGARPAHAKTG